MKDQWIKAGMVSSLGVEMALAVGLFTWGGHEADLRLGTAPALALSGFLLGLATAVFSMLRTLRRIEAMTPPAKIKRKDPGL
jgi:hypothetical protein